MLKIDRSKSKFQGKETEMLKESLKIKTKLYHIEKKTEKVLSKLEDILFVLNNSDQR